MPTPGEQRRRRGTSKYPDRRAATRGRRAVEKRPIQQGTSVVRAAPGEAEAYLKHEVRERAQHATAEEVRTTCSFARAERLLGREYHGRFLIELLQNAADAWRNHPSAADEGSRVAVLITEGPALLVANQGAPMTAEVVIESLGHIGASTKSEGEAIGHKGIGFKSVLEVTLAPEIYSGLQANLPALAVKFDPELAHSAIQLASPSWSALVAGVHGIDHQDELAAVPILRFPTWVDNLPSAVAELAADGFDTVVRLPFDDRFADRLNLGEAAWLKTVRDALQGVSDQMLLLLGCFSEVRVEDRMRNRSEIVTPDWEAPAVTHGNGSTREVVRILRNGELSSRWCLFRRVLPELEHLAGEIAVGLRLDGRAYQTAVLPAVDDEISAPFHLFFPTRIASGLPFLLHGYFEVDAGRTGFYRGSHSRNRAILRELAALAADAVRDAAEGARTDLVTLVDLVAAAGEPEEPLAREFRSAVLDHLDAATWVPVQAGDGDIRSSRPVDLFVTRPELTRQTAKVFPAAYVETRVRLGLPDIRLSDEALELVRSRQSEDGSDQWETLATLCRPGAIRIWDGSQADQGFLSLLDLLAALEVEDRAATTALINGLRGDPESRLLPTIGDDGGRILLPVPDPSEGVPGSRSRLLMARARATKGETLVPPEELDLAFLPEGLLASEADIDRAKPLGVRPFTVDNVLDRLNGLAEAEINPETLLRFLWQLLHRERQSGFGTRRSSERAAIFDPSEWFWCRPGRAREDDNARLRQQRERYLATVPLPCRDGHWRAAGTVGFGADWAGWLDSGAAGNPGSVTVQRGAAYRALETISQGPHALLAPPQVVLRYLETGTLDFPATEDEEPEEAMDDHQRNAERHAFLLRLGVWEVPPIEAFESRDPRNRANFPWTGPIADRQQAVIARAGGWTFGLDGWSGQRHSNVYLAEDYRFAWPLEEMADRDPSSLMVGLQQGARLYRQSLGALVFCPQCRDTAGSHSAARHSSAASGYPSSLALQLRHDRWAVCTLDGRELDRPKEPVGIWWHPKPPSGAGLRQSPYRLLPLCGPSTGMTDELRRLAGVNSLDDANLEMLRLLLLGLRSRFEQLTLPVDPSAPGTARQSFVSLHRLVYLRLADMANEHADEVTGLLAETGILCELGEGLVYRRPADARHDDGRFATYVRHFVGEVPLVTLPRDREVTAAALGIHPFVVQLTRRSADQGRDVTDELRSILGDRIPELLAIVVYHSLGTQTLELTSQQFDERARRLQALTVRQLDDLVIDASIPGGSFGVTLGEGFDQDLFLENPTSTSPVLFHDLTGDGWQDRLRRKLAPHLASVIENPSYSATFALFLQAESDAEREEFLLELGISSEEVSAIATRIGVADEEERQRYLRWYTAILHSQGMQVPEIDLDPAALTSLLSSADIPKSVVHRLVDAGGGEGVRSDTSEGSPLRLLADAEVDLSELDARLRELADPGLSISAGRRLLRRWLEMHGRRCAVVLATRQSPDIAKATVRTLDPPSELALSIDPPLERVLAPVAAVLRAAGIEVATAALAADPAQELARAGGFESVETLDARILLLYDEEEQRRALREQAAHWRRELRLLAVLARTGPAETRATIRAIDETLAGVLPANPARPSELIDALADLFVKHPRLADTLAPWLADSVTAALPDRSELLALAADFGVAADRLPAVERALEAPRRDQAREIKRKSARLAEGGVAPYPPSGLHPLPAKPPVGAIDRKKVATVKVEQSHDRRKRELGDEGEHWALAAVVGRFLKISIQERDAAVDQVLDLFDRFEGAPWRLPAPTPS
jgi:hypothetical protein